MKNLATIFLLSLVFYAKAQEANVLLRIDSLISRAAYEVALKELNAELASFNAVNNPSHFIACQASAAVCEIRLAQLDASEERISQVFSFYEKNALTDVGLKARIHTLNAERLLQSGRISRALDELSLAESLVITDNKLMADIYNLQGVAHWNNGNSNLALQYHERALSLREKFDNSRLAVADSENNIGLIYLETNPSSAEEYFNAALDAYTELLGNNHPKVAFCLLNLARTASLQNNVFLALNRIQRVQDIWNNNINGDHPNKAFTFAITGDILVQQSNYASAIESYSEALAMLNRLYGKKHPEIANTYFQMGAAYQKMDEFKMALDHYQEAIFANLPNQSFEDNYDDPDIDGYYNADYLLSAMLAKAKALEAVHFEKSLKPRDIKSALRTYELADALLESIRRNRPVEKDKLNLGATSRIIYDNGIRLSLVLADQPFSKSKYYEQAYRFLEKSKASVLMDAIQDTHAKSYAGIPTEITQLDDSLKTEITYYQQQVSAGKNLVENSQKLFDLQNAHRSLINKMEMDFPQYYSLKYEESNYSLQALQAYLMQGQMVLNYYVTDDNIYIFQITSDNLEIDMKPKPDNYKKLLRGLRNGLKYNAEDMISDHASSLYEMLLPKIQDEFYDLIILPDGELSDIPFEVLYSQEENKYLLEKSLISYNFSGALILQNQGVSGKSKKSAMLIAPVSFENMGVLPGTEKEANALKYMFASKNHEVSLRLYDDATETFIKGEDLSDYGYLHFATHGIVDEMKPELSGIFLKRDDQEDGMFYAGDIYNTTINADMVTLSACETGLGQQVTGEGLLGLSRAFTYAGANNLVVSLWKVADASTSSLMVDFYRHHLLDPDENSFKESLRYAKVRLMRSEEYSSPYYWAPFILIGR